MTNEIIGHYASHPGGGWRTPNKSNLRICPTCGVTYEKTGSHECEDYPVKAFPTVQFSTGTQPSDLELKIRKEVMELLNGIHDELETHICTDDEFKSIRIALANLDRTKDRLELLWGKE